MSTLKHICDEYEIPNSLIKTLKSMINKKFQDDYHDRYLFLGHLPTNIRNEIILLMYKQKIKNHTFFKGHSIDFVLFLLPLLKSYRVEKNETLCSVGDFLEEMYIVQKGSLSINLSEDFDKIEIGKITDNYYYGDLFIQTNTQTTYEIKGKSKLTEILLLSKTDFLLTKNNFKANILDILERSYEYFSLLEKRKKIFVRVYKLFKNREELGKKIKLLDIYLLNLGFKNFFEKGIDPITSDFFLMHNNINYINEIFKSFNKKSVINNDESVKKTNTKDICFKKRKRIFMENSEDVIKKTIQLKRHKFIETQNYYNELDQNTNLLSILKLNEEFTKNYQESKLQRETDINTKTLDMLKFKSKDNILKTTNLTTHSIQRNLICSQKGFNIKGYKNKKKPLKIEKFQFSLTSNVCEKIVCNNNITFILGHNTNSVNIKEEITNRNQFNIFENKFKKIFPQRAESIQIFENINLGTESMKNFIQDSENLNMFRMLFYESKMMLKIEKVEYLVNKLLTNT